MLQTISVCRAACAPLVVGVLHVLLYVPVAARLGMGVGGGLVMSTFIISLLVVNGYIFSRAESGVLPLVTVPVTVVTSLITFMAAPFIAVFAVVGSAAR